MKKTLLILAPLACAALIASACAPPPATNTDGGGDAAFKSLHDRYVVEFLRRNPQVNTYLGGAGLDSSLGEADGRLRDHSAAALEAEDRWLEETRKSFEAANPQALSPARRIDREVALAQIRFLLRQHKTRRQQERAVDTYVTEPFRSVDFQLQGMTDVGGGSYGTEEEWALVLKRVEDVPRFLAVAQEQLRAGIARGNTPDRRMLLRDGVNSSEANAKYFGETLPKLLQERYSPKYEGRDAFLGRARGASAAASKAYADFRDFIRAAFFDGPATAGPPTADAVKAEFRADRYAAGEEEYDWALKNNLRLDKTAAQLFVESWPVVEATRKEMTDLARRVGEKRGMQLPADGAAAVRAVFDELSKDYPKSDDEMVAWYRDTCFRVVEYGRKTGVFDVPADYKLDVTITPPPLRSSIDGAAYYPAPPFKTSGVGRFYVSPTDNDPAALQANNRAALADLSVHEGFPGHDWHYKVLTQYKNEIAAVRWLTPGAVEDSSSMWEDSMASEGWALYSEALMAEPQPAAPEGFYTPEERLYQLQGKLLRDLRVRIDTGLHTDRMTYDEATDLYSEVVDFLPAKCADPSKSDAKRASCESAERAIFRYSKWPTQAITYRLGKEQIYALREEAARAAGAAFSPKTFHLLFMKQGTIPAGYFREELLRELQKK